ncbi:hypothetical protein ABVT39_027033 [Epinephelus coioides]
MIRGKSSTVKNKRRLCSLSVPLSSVCPVSLCPLSVPLAAESRRINLLLNLFLHQQRPAAKDRLCSFRGLTPPEYWTFGLVFRSLTAAWNLFKDPCNLFTAPLHPGNSFKDSWNVIKDHRGNFFTEQQKICTGTET